MNFRAGFQSFELLRAFELPKPLVFQSHEDALKWLKQLGSLHPEAIRTFRDYLSRISDNPECSRLTDHEALERVAEALYARKMVIVVREERSGSKAPDSKPQSVLVPFPLSERNSRGSAVSSPPPPPDDPATFDERLDAVAQAAALVAAANGEWPLCPE
jgi:hypothetical protein